MFYILFSSSAISGYIRARWIKLTPNKIFPFHPSVKYNNIIWKFIYLSFFRLCCLCVCIKTGDLRRDISFSLSLSLISEWLGAYYILQRWRRKVQIPPPPKKKKRPIARVGWLNIITTKLSWQFGWRRTCFASSLSLIPFRLSLRLPVVKRTCRRRRRSVCSSTIFRERISNGGGGARQLLIADDLVTLWECWLTMAAPPPSKLSPVKLRLATHVVSIRHTRVQLFYTIYIFDCVKTLTTQYCWDEIPDEWVNNVCAVATGSAIRPDTTRPWRTECRCCCPAGNWG